MTRHRYPLFARGMANTAAQRPRRPAIATIARDEHEEARTLVPVFADSRRGFCRSKSEIIEANHWLLKHGELSESDRLLRLEHLHSTDLRTPSRRSVCGQRFLIETSKPELFILKQRWRTSNRVPFVPAGLAPQSLKLGLKRFERAAEICTTLLSEHHDFRTAIQAPIMTSSSPSRS